MSSREPFDVNHLSSKTNSIVQRVPFSIIETDVMGVDLLRLRRKRSTVVCCQAHRRLALCLRPPFDDVDAPVFPAANPSFSVVVVNC